MKWIEQQERMLQIQQSYSREPMDSILCHFLYVNLENNIEKVTSERINLIVNTDKNIISMEHVLQLIQSNRISTPNTKYIFQESFLYHVDLESENLQQYIQGDNSIDISKRFFHVLPLLDDIVLPSSIFIFHHLNSLYFLFKEVSNKHHGAIKSILKGSGTRKKTHGLGIECDDKGENKDGSRLENIMFNKNKMFEEEDGKNTEVNTSDTGSHVRTENKRVTMKVVPKIFGRIKRKKTSRFTRKNMEE
jgi:hypothetical protein